MAVNIPTFCCFIDMQKAFDWVGREMLLYKLLQCNIDGRVYRAVKALHFQSSACVRLNNIYCSGWFETKSGVKQGDPLSPTLFGIFLDDLIT